MGTKGPKKGAAARVSATSSASLHRKPRPPRHRGGADTRPTHAKVSAPRLTTWEWGRIWLDLMNEYLSEAGKAEAIFKQAKTPADEVRLSRKARKHMKRMMEIERELKLR